MIGVINTSSLQHVLAFINLEKNTAYNLFLFQRQSGFTKKQKSFQVFTKEISKSPRHSPSISNSGLNPPDSRV